MNDRNIGLSLTGDHVPLKSLTNAADKLSGLLSELERSLSGAQQLGWYVADLRMGSVNLAIRPKSASQGSPEIGKTIISVALSGLEMIEREVGIFFPCSDGSTGADTGVL